MLTLAFALLLTGAGCSGAATSDSSGGSAGSAGVSVSEIEGFLLGSLYNEHNGNTDGYKDYIFTEEEGSCGDASLGTLSYLYDDARDVQVGSADIQDGDGLVSLATESNAMSWYFFDAEGGTVSCDYDVTGATFDVTCAQGGAEYCAGTFSGVATK